MILSELIERINVVSGVDTDPEVLIEVILPRCMHVIASNAANDPAQLEALRKAIAITFVAGIGTLPEEIKEEFVSTLFFSKDPMMSYIPNWLDYSSNSFTILGGFTVRNGSIYATDSGGVATSGSNIVNVVCVPKLPSLIGDTVDIRDTVLQQIITLAASVINEQTSLPTISIDYPDIGEKQE